MTRKYLLERLLFHSDMNSLFHSTGKEFSNIVILAKECQGQMLWKIAEAARPIVEGIYQKNLGPSERFAIEDAQRDEILQYRKGADNLLELLRKTSVSSSDSIEPKGVA